MNDLITAATSGLFVEVGKIIQHMEAQASRIAELETKLQEQDAMLGRRPCINNRCMDMVSAQSRIADLERENSSLAYELNIAQSGGSVAIPAAPSAPAVEHQPVHLWHKVGTSDWYFGYPDHSDGGGPYETRTLYAAPQAADTDKVREAFGEKFTKGDDYEPSNSLPCAGINVTSVHDHIHGNAIEFFAEKLADAQRRRDFVLAAIASTAAQAPVREVPEGIELLSDLMDSIRKHGNYSEEATLNFLGQIKQCFDAAIRASSQKEGGGHG